MPMFSSLDPPLRRAIVFALILVLHLPFLAGISERLLSKEHYQFFPILIAAIAVLDFIRLRDAVWPEQSRLTARVT